MAIPLVVMLTLAIVATPEVAQAPEPTEPEQTAKGCKLIVEGTVVDQLGQPDGDAVVMALAYEDGVGRSGGACSIGLTDPDGHFSCEYSGPCAPLPDRTYLFVINKVGPLMRGIDASKNPHWVMSPPFKFTPSKLGPRFRGFPVAVKGRNRLDVGKVRARLQYGEALVKLLDPAGKPLVIKEEEIFYRPFLWLTIRDEHGEVTEESGVPRNAVLFEESSIWLALPEGRWQIEVWTDPADLASERKWIEVTTQRKTTVELVLQPR